MGLALSVTIGFILSGSLAFAQKDVSTSHARPTDVTDASVMLRGQKADDLIAILEKTKAADPEPSCGMGKCYKEGVLEINCKSPMASKDKQRCTITAQDKVVKGKPPTKKPEVYLSGDKAQKMINLMESAHADETTADACSMGSCYAVGKIKVVCSFPTNGKRMKNECEVSAATPSKSTPPSTTKPAGTR